MSRATSTFALDINACRYRRSTSVVLQVTMHIAVRRTRCVTFNLPSPPPRHPAYYKSRTESRIYLSIALVTNFAAAGLKKCYYNRQYIYFDYKSLAQSHAQRQYFTIMSRARIFFSIYTSVRTVIILETGD